MNDLQLLRPPPLNQGDTIGVFTPSTPANVGFRAKYERGLQGDAAALAPLLAFVAIMA